MSQQVYYEEGSTRVLNIVCVTHFERRDKGLQKKMIQNMKKRKKLKIKKNKKKPFKNYPFCVELFKGIQAEMKQEKVGRNRQKPNFYFPQ